MRGQRDGRWCLRAELISMNVIIYKKNTVENKSIRWKWTNLNSINMRKLIKFSHMVTMGIHLRHQEINSRPVKTIVNISFGVKNRENCKFLEKFSANYPEKSHEKISNRAQFNLLHSCLFPDAQFSTTCDASFIQFSFIWAFFGSKTCRIKNLHNFWSKKKKKNSIVNMPIKNLSIDSLTHTRQRKRDETHKIQKKNETWPYM